MADNKKIRRFKLAPPPPELPIYGKVKPEHCSFIGRTNYEAALQEQKYVFGLKRTDRRSHVYIVGKSGVGKSKLLEVFLRQDIVYNHGFCLIDPHGDLIENILDFIPEERINDVVFIDPSDVKHPISFNPLANVDPNFKHQLTQGLIEVLERQFGANWTPRLEHVLRFACLALLDYPNATMQDIISMLTDKNYRQLVIEHIEDDMVKRFWTIEFADWSGKHDTEAIIPLVNKLAQFLSHPMLRSMFLQKENKIDLEELMHKGSIILVNLSKGKLGKENASFFGSMLLVKIKQASMARASLPEKERKDFYLYIDEFPALATEIFENILSEAKKFGICLTVAHQYMGQLPQRVQQAILVNIGTIIVFRVGGEDAVRLEPEMAPMFGVKDMVNLGVRNFYIKETIDGEVYDPFSAETLKILQPTHESLKKQIIERSRIKYAISVDQTKKLIQEAPDIMLSSRQEPNMKDERKFLGEPMAPQQKKEEEPLK